MRWVRREELDRAKVDAYAAHDRLDTVLGENERLLAELAKANERLEMMSVCVIDTLREALGMEQPKQESGFAPLIEAMNPHNPEIPKEVQAAIDETFPDDTVIRSANLKYAYSQAHRWDDYAKEVADEIRQGA